MYQYYSFKDFDKIALVCRWAGLKYVLFYIATDKYKKLDAIRKKRAHTSLLSTILSCR